MTAFLTVWAFISPRISARQWQEVDRARCELDRERRLWLAGRPGLVIIRPHALQDQRQIGPQDAVFVEALHPVERVVDGLDLGDLVERGADGAGRIEAMLEELHEAARDRRMTRQRLFHIALAEIRAGLAQHLA